MRESAPPAWRQELRTRWGLAVLKALGVLFLVRSAFTDWLSLRVRVDELRDDTVRQGAAEGAVFALQATDASALLAFGAVLLGVAAARAWWHGWEEVPSGAGECRWLPGALEGSLRS